MPLHFLNVRNAQGKAAVLLMTRYYLPSLDKYREGGEAKKKKNAGIAPKRGTKRPPRRISLSKR